MAQILWHLTESKTSLVVDLRESNRKCEPFCFPQCGISRAILRGISSGIAAKSMGAVAANPDSRPGITIPLQEKNLE